MKLVFHFISALALSFTLSNLINQPAQAAVWQDTNQWSAAWEARYADWVRANWNIHIFSSRTLPNGQKNPYYGLRTDCADTVYSMRIIFAYENGLPFVIQDPTSTGATLSNKMSRFDGESSNDRIRHFLSYMYDLVSTHSLPNDTYPVAITRQTVHAGGLMMTVAKNHHSWSIKEILPIGVPYLVFNSVLGSGTSSVLQERQSWPNPEWVFEGNQTPQGNGGFRYWKPLASIQVPSWQVPGYSEEQYHVPTSKWVSFAQKRLATQQEGDTEKLERLITTACEGMQSRVPAVRDAVTFQQSRGGACITDYETYDNYSTPSRDHRIFDDLMALRSSYEDVLNTNGGSSLSTAMQAQLTKIFPLINQRASVETQRMAASGLSAASICVIAYGTSKQLDMAEFKRRLFVGWISNNPIEYRWGELRGPSNRAQNCPSWDAWSPQFGTN